MTGITGTLLFIVNFFGKIYVSIILLRFLLQMVGADFYNPISQFIIKVTHPLLKPLRKIIPSIGRQDIAALVLAYLVEIAIVCILLILIGIPLGLAFTKIPIIAFIKLIDIAFNTLFWLFIGNAVLSWIAPDSRSPAAELIRQICDYILKPLQRIIPPIGIIDITPMIALVLLFFVNNFVVQTLSSYFNLGI